MDFDGNYYGIMSAPELSVQEVQANLSERGQLEWELAAQRAMIAKLQAERCPCPDCTCCSETANGD